MLIPCKQNSAEWLHERVSCVTASRVKDVMDFLKKGGPSQKRKDYMAEIIAETLTGVASEHYVSPYMQWGLEFEREARAAYEIESGNIVDQTGIFAHDVIARFKASPDGLIGTDGLWEGKCPQTTTHLAWLEAGVIPEEHMPQCLAQLSCSGRQWLQFSSFDPRLPEPLQLFNAPILRRDEDKIREVEDAVLTFLEETHARIQGIMAKVGVFDPITKTATPRPTDPIGDSFITDAEIEWAAGGFK